MLVRLETPPTTDKLSTPEILREKKQPMPSQNTLKCSIRTELVTNLFSKLKQRRRLENVSKDNAMRES